MSRFFKLTNHVFKNKSPKKLLTKEGDSLKAIILDFSGTICDPYVFYFILLTIFKIFMKATKYYQIKK
jgi:hypothetical protein